MKCTFKLQDGRKCKDEGEVGKESRGCMLVKLGMQQGDSDTMAALDTGNSSNVDVFYILKTVVIGCIPLIQVVISSCNPPFGLINLKSNNAFNLLFSISFDEAMRIPLLQRGFRGKF